MTISYNSSIPNPPNAPSADVSTMQSNAAAINTWVGIDHFGFNIANGGTHQKVTMFNRTQPSLGSANGILWCGSGLPNWVNAAGNNVLAFVGTSSSATNGYINLPGGLILQWGVI